MKNTFIFGLLILLVTNLSAQVGIGTVSPNSTLDVRGSFSASSRAFAASTAASATDYALVFTGAVASAVTLPDATACTGRMYLIKNASLTGPTPVLTINTTGAQTIDGIASWLLNQSYESVILASDGANWRISAQTASAGAGTAWTLAGNNVVVLQTFGTISNFDLPFITNNTEKMRVTATGNLGVGTSVFNVANPEKLVVDAGATASVNAIVGKGNINNYLQLNIQNNNAGANASSDVVATADNGNETSNYVDLGINSSVNTSGVMGNPDDAYLYNLGQNFLMGTGAAGKALVFMTGGTTQATNERMRIDGSGNVGIGINNPAYKLHVLAASNPLYLAGVQTGLGTDSLLTIINGVVRKISPSVNTAGMWALGGNSVASVQTFGTTSNFDLPFITNNTEKMRITATGNLGVGTSVFNVANPEKLVVDAGATASVNAIVGKGNINNYLQLNIQNNNAGTNASSDVVATADNGNETSNYVDLGINSSVNTSGVMGNPDDAYLYNLGQNFLMGTGAAGKALVFMTGGTTQATNERMRIDGSGNVGIATNLPAAKLDINGTFKLGSTGAVLNNIMRGSFTIADPTAFSRSITNQQTVAVAGATMNATVIVTPRSALPNSISIGWAWVSSAGNVTIGFMNCDQSPQALGTATFDITIIQ